MLDPARLRKDLWELLLRHGDERRARPKNDRARRGRALVDNENMPGHRGYPSPNVKGSGAEPDRLAINLFEALGLCRGRGLTLQEVVVDGGRKCADRRGKSNPDAEGEDEH